MEYDEYGEEGDIYSEEGRGDLVEDDAIEPWEEGFMQGEERLSNEVCDNCGKMLNNPDRVYGRKIGSEQFRFCTKRCRAEYLRLSEISTQ